MGIFRNPNFIAEFSYRTKMNYYNLRLLQDNTPEETQRIYKCISVLEEEMRKRHYIIEDFYEVTQLINSLVGLLVFPEQKAYKSISEEPSDLEKIFPTLYKYISLGEEFFYTNYLERKKGKRVPKGEPEEVNPQNMVKHLRNAVAHNEIGIFPENGRLKNGDLGIRYVVFKDKMDWSYKGVDYKMRFKLRVDIEDLELLIMEICDEIISLT